LYKLNNNQVELKNNNIVPENDLRDIITFKRNNELDSTYLLSGKKVYFLNQTKDSVRGVILQDLSSSTNFQKIYYYNHYLFVLGFNQIIRKNYNLVPVQNNQTVNKFELSQNYPNPFNPNTTISFILAYNQNVSIKVYDIDGKLIKILVDKKLSKGNHSVLFDGSNLSSGIYFYQFKTDSLTETKKMILVK